MKAFWKYTLARFALFFVTYYVIWSVVGIKREIAVIDPFILLAAIIVSGVISLFALRRLRDEVATHVLNRSGRKPRAANREADDLD